MLTMQADTVNPEPRPMPPVGFKCEFCGRRDELVLLAEGWYCERCEYGWTHELIRQMLGSNRWA